MAGLNVPKGRVSGAEGTDLVRPDDGRKPPIGADLVSSDLNRHLGGTLLPPAHVTDPCASILMYPMQHNPSLRPWGSPPPGSQALG